MNALSTGTLILGGINGMLIGLLAVGIVLVYKSNRFLNMAHAQLGAFSAQLLAKMVIDFGVSWWIAIVVCVPIGMGVGVGVERFVVRPLRRQSASAIALLLTTIGVAQLLLAFALVPALGPKASDLSSQGYPLPFDTTVKVGGVILTSADILVIVLVPVLVGALAVFLRYTLLGKMIRAAASNPEAARLYGISIDKMSSVSWALAGAASAIGAILQSPSTSTFSVAALGPRLLLLALGAAAFGAFTSLPLTLIGGLGLGIAQQVALGGSSNAGVSELVVFLLILAIVLTRGKDIGRVFQSAGAVMRDRPPIRIPASVTERFTVRYQRHLLVAGALAVGALAPLIPSLRNEGNQFQLALVLIYALISISITVAIGWAGQVSLGHFAVVGSGAFIAARLLESGRSLLLALLVSGLVGALIMILIGLPALRVPGLSLAVTTLGFAMVAPDWLFRQSWFGTARSLGFDVSTPGLLRGLGKPESEIIVYYVALVFIVGAGAGLWKIRRALPGRLVIAVRDNENKAAALGVTPATIKLAALSISGGLAASAGALWADAWHSVGSAQFPAEVSLSVLAAPVIGGVGSIGGAIAGAVLLYAPIFFLSPYLGEWFGPAGDLGFALLFGGLGLIVVMRRYPTGLSGIAQDWWQRRLDAMAEQAVSRPDPVASSRLSVQDVHLRFGGITALDGASIDIHPGEIVGLIGPNGAGKSTLMNVISGLVTPDQGDVRIGGVDVGGLAPELRFSFGLARTFQNAELFPGLTVLEMMQVATSEQYRTGFVASALGVPWVRLSESRSKAAAAEALERFGLTPWAHTLSGDLSTGTRRICDLAVQVAARPKVLLLDEPTAGVAQREAEAFGPLLRRIRAELDCSILLIEHDMPLLMHLCDRVYAMEGGRIVATGTPAEVRDNPAVIASYLGTSKTAIDRSNSAPDTRQHRTSESSRRPLRARGAGSSNGEEDGSAPVANGSGATGEPGGRARSGAARRKPPSGT